MKALLRRHAKLAVALPALSRVEFCLVGTLNRILWVECTAFADLHLMLSLVLSGEPLTMLALWALVMVHRGLRDDAIKDATLLYQFSAHCGT